MTSRVSDLSLALWIAVATLLGGIGASLFDTFVLDANTERETNVQLIELAIGILGQPIEIDGAQDEDSPDMETLRSRISRVSPNSPQTALRTWAVDTINASAEVKFGEEARAVLIDGRATLPKIKFSEFGINPLDDDAIAVTELILRLENLSRVRPDPPD